MAWSLPLKSEAKGLRKEQPAGAPRAGLSRARTSQGRCGLTPFQLSFHSLRVSQDCVRAPGWTLFTQRSEVRSSVQGEGEGSRTTSRAACCQQVRGS